MAKSTMVELIPELEKLTDNEHKVRLLEEAKRGEYHDYKNRMYACGKVTLATVMANWAKLYPQDAEQALKIRNDVINGEYDETADEEDKAYLRKTIDENSKNNREAAALKNMLGL